MMLRLPRAGTLAAMTRNQPATALLTAGILAFGVLVTACGSQSAPGGATDSTSTGSSAGGNAPGKSLLAYSTCMRSHGVPNFPDPSSTGGIPKEELRQLGISQSQLNTANRACQHLIPAGESLSGQTPRTIPAQDQRDYLKAAACMRSHGITSFPEPAFQNGQVEFPRLEHLVDINSPQFRAAVKICQKDIPPGLPDSGSQG